MHKHIRKTLLTFTFAFFFLQVSSQTGPPIEWQNTIGGNMFDRVNSIVQTNDGGYTIAGRSLSDISGDKNENSQGSEDFWIVKTDSLGNIVWQNTIGGLQEDLPYYIIQTNDGGYLVCGTSRSPISGDITEAALGGSFDAYILRLDASGNILWQNMIGGSMSEYAQACVENVDGSFLLAIQSDSDSSGDKTENSIGAEDFWLVKTDPNGNILWQNTIGGSGNDYVARIKTTSDGGIILSGSSLSNISGDKSENSFGILDYWMVKTDSMGNVLWDKTYGGNDNEALSSLDVTSDNGFILAGSSKSNASGSKSENSLGQYDYWIVKTDSAGNLEWENTIGGSDFDYANCVHQTNSNEFVICGRSQSNISGDKNENSLGDYDIWLVKTDMTGNIIWDNTIGGSGYDLIFDFKITSDNGYILGGNSSSTISGDKTEDSIGVADFWLIKLAAESSSSVGEYPYHDDKVFVFPNPATDEINIKNIGNENVFISMYDVLGRNIFENESVLSNSKTKMRLQELTEGIYTIQIRNSKGESLKTEKISVIQ